MQTFQNPILPGFYPDPSICRVGEDYYLITSTFEYFPGLPIFHSRDLVHWQQLGHILDRPSQLNLDSIRSQLGADGVRPTGGLYAPTIRYHAGTFYVINTLVDQPAGRDNFIVTATHPAGPWSEPVWLEDAPGIDPSLLFDDDGRVWYTGNRVPPAGEQFTGHREIWLQELDLPTMQLTGPKHSLWDGALKGGVHAEAPHLYKINGMYYLLIAEGGTHHNHAVTIARSKHITGPYEANPRNPILTHRHLGLDYPIVGTGHADLVETQHGEWWLVALAMRPYDGYFYNLGRETFLAPVRWEEDWPIVSPGAGRIEFEYPVPNLPEHRWPTQPACDNFEAETLAGCWNFIRTPRDDFYSLTERPGYLRLRLRPQMLSEQANPSFVGRRQQHINFAARTVMDFSPQSADECAGIVLLQNSNFHFRFVVTQVEGKGSMVRLIKREHGEETVLAEKAIETKRVYFKVEAVGQRYSFYIATAAEAWQVVAQAVDGRILSTPVAGGFVGAYLGMYASSNGQPGQNVADFDWFEYRALGA
ncbi:MAG: glycoside hydrolase family 43 protein [Anaerolineae bacterium]|nr:glycoside hydrolase family 43 protein [Anaerolineae bacterium]